MQGDKLTETDHHGCAVEFLCFLTDI